MKLAENIAVSESGFIFDPNSGESFSVNHTGKEILKLLAEGKSQNEIIDLILSDYDIEKDVLNRYLDDFVHTLRRYNFIESEDDE